MNSGIIRNALTMTLALEREYREPYGSSNWSRIQPAYRTSIPTAIV